MADQSRPENSQATKTSNKTTGVATKILLDDANNGFKNGNFVCSPFSLEVVLGMLAFGAEGETLKQLLGFIGHNSIDELESMSSVSKLLEHILLDTGKGEGGHDVLLANGVWVDEGWKPVKSCYQDVLETVYKTKAECIDIQNKPAESAQIINSWVKEKTNGLIPNIIGGLSPDDVIVIANALYFKGIWSKPFSLGDTKKKKFHLINGEKVSVPFMTCYKEFDCGSFKGYQMIKFPYESTDQSNEFSMYIFLPHRLDGLKDLLQVFESDQSLFYGDFNLEKRRFNELWIPKFEIACTFEPSDVMKELGLTLPFDVNNKELNGIVEQKYPYDKKFYVSKVLQKSFIKVDEKGTEAAAASTFKITKGGGRRFPLMSEFVADHPFMFMIREDTSRAILFSGVVVNPRIKR